MLRRYEKKHRAAADREGSAAHRNGWTRREAAIHPNSASGQYVVTSGHQVNELNMSLKPVEKLSRGADTDTKKGLGVYLFAL